MGRPRTGGEELRRRSSAGPSTFPDFDTFTRQRGKIFPPGVPWNTLVLQVRFGLTPHDRVVLNGAVDVEPRVGAVLSRRPCSGGRDASSWPSSRRSGEVTGAGTLSRCSRRAPRAEAGEYWAKNLDASEDPGW